MVGSSNELFVASWVEVLNQVLFLGEAIRLDWVKMRVDVSRPTGDGADLFLVIRESVVQVFGLPEILGCPFPSRVLLAKNVVARFLGKFRADRVDVMGVGFPGLAGPVAGRCVAHVWLMIEGRVLFPL